MTPTVRHRAIFAKRRARFLVGYVAAGNTLYGKTVSTVACTDPLTRREAQRQLAVMPCAGAAIFELTLREVNR